MALASERERMESEPYAPIPGDATLDNQNAHSLKYIAFYLGKIANELHSLNSSAASLEKTVQAISSKKAAVGILR